MRVVSTRRIVQTAVLVTARLLWGRRRRTRLGVRTWRGFRDNAVRAPVVSQDQSGHDLCQGNCAADEYRYTLNEGHDHLELLLTAITEEPIALAQGTAAASWDAVLHRSPTASAGMSASVKGRSLA